MVRLHALELTPSADGIEAVRRDWAALRDAGLPSQLDHRGSTNQPHVTLIATESPVPSSVRSLAVELVSPLLPVSAAVAGLVVFGGTKVTLAWALEVPDTVTAVALELRAATTGHRHPGWVPHLTLARRVPRDDLSTALAVLGSGHREVTLASLRHWDPDADAIHTLG